MGADGEEHAADRSVAAAVLSGKSEAIGELERRFDDLFSQCFRSAKRRWAGVPIEEADLRQEMRLMICANDYRILRSYRGESSIEGWMRSVLLRHIHRRLAARADELRRRRSTPPGPIDAEVVPSAEATVLAEERRRQIASAVAALPREDQLLIKLTYEDDAPARVIGAALGISEDAVRMRKMRLLKRLGEVLAHE